MHYLFPPDVQELVQEQMASHGYASEDQLLRDALRAFSELRSRQEQLVRDVRVGLDQADAGLAKPLDVDDLLRQWTERLSSSAITE